MPNQLGDLVLTRFVWITLVSTLECQSSPEGGCLNKCQWIWRKSLKRLNSIEIRQRIKYLKDCLFHALTAWRQEIRQGGRYNVLPHSREKTANLYFKQQSKQFERFERTKRPTQKIILFDGSEWYVKDVLSICNFFCKTLSEILLYKVLTTELMKMLIRQRKYINIWKKEKRRRSYHFDAINKTTIGSTTRPS